MGKFFGLFIFIDFFLVGIFLGTRRGRWTLKTVSRVFGFFLLIYTLMGLMLTSDLSFVMPK